MGPLEGPDPPRARETPYEGCFLCQNAVPRRRRRTGSHHALLQRRAAVPCQLSDAEPIRTSRVFPPFWIASASQSAMELRPHHSRLLLVPKNNSLTKRNACLRELPSGMGLSRSGAKFHPHSACRSCRHRCRRDSGRRCGFLLGQSSGSRALSRGTYLGPACRGSIGARQCVR